MLLTKQKCYSYLRNSTIASSTTRCQKLLMIFQLQFSMIWSVMLENVKLLLKRHQVMQIVSFFNSTSIEEILFYLEIL